ncbi:MAG: DUF86 domain-containing protein [Candidatus Magnetoovum sp. WYHC-5]|nr:DUF86 domain-containing protein [Candidatus Magnetoovum sp. WYHC-5]
MTRSSSLFIKDIIDNMDKAEEFIGNLSFNDFSIDLKTVYAVVRCIEIIGEASKKCAFEYKAKIFYNSVE